MISEYCYGERLEKCKDCKKCIRNYNLDYVFEYYMIDPDIINGDCLFFNKKD